MEFLSHLTAHGLGELGHAIFFLCLWNNHIADDISFSSYAIPVLTFDSSDGRVVRVSASGAVDLGLIPSRVKPMTLKIGMHCLTLNIKGTV